MYRAMSPSNWKTWNPKLKVATTQIPTLILWGQHDPYLPNWLPEQYGAEKIVRFEDSGHWAPAEETELFAKHVKEFFSNHA